MRPFTSTIPFDEALGIALDATTAIARTETIAIGDADGRVVATDVVSSLDVPPFDRSAMDGYAVRSADCSAPGAVLRMIGRVFVHKPFGHAGRGDYNFAGQSNTGCEATHGG